MRRSLHIITTALLLVCCIGLQAQSVASSKDRKARLERDIRILERQVAEGEKKSADATKRLTLLKAQTEARRELLKESEQDLRLITDSVRLCKKQISQVEARLDTMKRYYGDLVHSAYKYRDSRVWYLYILASDNLGQGLRRYGYLRQLSVRMNEQGRRIGEEKERLEAKELREKAYAEIAGLEELDKEADIIARDAVSKTVAGDFAGAKALREKREELKKKRAALLEKAGHGADYTDTKYLCGICKDTGFTEEGARCSCYEQRAKEAKEWQISLRK